MEKKWLKPQKNYENIKRNPSDLKKIKRNPKQFGGQLDRFIPQTTEISIPLPLRRFPTVDARTMISTSLQLPFFIFLLQFTAFASCSPTTAISSSTHSNLTHILQVPYPLDPITPFTLSAKIKNKNFFWIVLFIYLSIEINQDVLKAISAKQRWDLNEVRVSKLDVGKVRFGTSQSYELRIGSGKNNLTLKFSDQVSSWNKFRTTPKPDLGSLLRGVASLAILDSIKLEGPFELRVDDDLHHLSLSLPVRHHFPLPFVTLHSCLFIFFVNYPIQISTCYESKSFFL